MQVRHIFERISARLYVVVYEPETNQTAGNIEDEDEDEEGKDELELAFSRWRNPGWLWKFYSKFRRDLQEEDPTISVKNAVSRTLEEADHFHAALVRIATRGTEDELMKLFKPLHDREEGQKAYELQHIKVKQPRCWLRLYALRYRGGFIITGSAIKITRKMNHRPHLKKELDKLRMVQKFLGEEESEKAFVYLEI